MVSDDSNFSAGAGDVVRFVEADLRKRAEDVVDRARRLCIANSVTAATNSPHCSVERNKNISGKKLLGLYELHFNDRCTA
jgi:hypothetical protein